MQTAIATRPGLSALMTTVLADKAHPDALVMLTRNVSADIPDVSLLRMVERSGDDGQLSEAILERDDLPATVRGDLVRSTATAPADFVSDCGWLARDRADHIKLRSGDSCYCL